MIPKCKFKIVKSLYYWQKESCTSSGRFRLLIEVKLVVVPLAERESLLTALTLIDEVAPDITPVGFGCNDGGWLWFKGWCLEVLTLLTIVALEPPIPDVRDVIPVASSSDDLLVPRVAVSVALLPTLAVGRSLWVCGPEVTVAVVLVEGIVLLREGGVEEEDEPPRIGG